MRTRYKEVYARCKDCVGSCGGPVVSSFLEAHALIEKLPIFGSVALGKGSDLM